MNVYTYAFQLALGEYGTGQGIVIADDKRVARKLIKSDDDFIKNSSKTDPKLEIKLAELPQNGCKVFDFTYIE